MERAGMTDKERNEIERLTQALRQALMNPFRRDADEATLEAAEEAGLVKRVALAQSDAEPSHGVRDKLAIHLMAAGECSGDEDPQRYVEFFTKYLAEQRGAEHSGDCKKQPWTCSHCVCDEHLAKADHFIAAFPAITKSYAEPKMRHVLERCRTVLGNMALENNGSFFMPRWPIHHEPLRNDAKNLLPLIDAVLEQSDAEPVAWREALEQQLLDLVELARDTRSDKGGEARWTHPIGALTREFAKRLTAPPRPDVSAGLIEAAENVVIAFGMGWDMEGVIERLIETLPQDSVCRARAADRSQK